jgi:hypothetical protein
MNDAQGILEEFVEARNTAYNTWQEWVGFIVYDPAKHNSQKRDSERWSRKVTRRERTTEYINRWSSIKVDPVALETRRARERVYDAKRRAK